MIKKEDFSVDYSPEKIEELLANNPKHFYYKEAFRIIKHSKDVKMEEKDFYPSIMEYNNPPYTMPSFESQNRKKGWTKLGVSCFDTYDHLYTYIESVTSLREALESNDYYIVQGFVNEDLGFADEAEKVGDRIGHFNYYLFDPIRKNPLNDFNESEQKK